MSQKHGKTDVVSFRAPRNIADLITNHRLNILDLVEKGILSYSTLPGSKSEQILNGLIGILDIQIADLQERKEQLLKLKEKVAPPKTSSVNVPTKVKCDILVHGIKTNTLYWTTQEIADNCKDLFSHANWEEDTGDDYEQIFCIDDIPECEV